MSLYATVGTVIAWNKIKASEYNTVASALNSILSLFAGNETIDLDFANNPTTYYAPVAGEPSAGTLHLIPEASRPSSWVLSAGTATSFTDVDFSAYVPSGVKALLLKYYIRWEGDGSNDTSWWQLRQNGSSETDGDKISSIGFTAENLASGIVNALFGQLTQLCDSDGIIEYRSYNGDPANGAISISIQGYYI